MPAEFVVNSLNDGSVGLSSALASFRFGAETTALATVDLGVLHRACTAVLERLALAGRDRRV